MIVTIATSEPQDAAGLVAENLALLRARSGRKVLLMDATSRQACQQWATERERLHLGPALTARAVRGFGLPEELERLYPRFADVVIATDGGNGHECRSALIMAQVAVVPLAPEQADIDGRYDLIARLNSARMFNPGLRVLFVTAGSEHDPAPRELLAMRGYAAQVMAGGLAGTILHLPALLWGADRPGRCASDNESSTGAAEMAALYEEVYQASCAIPPARRNASIGPAPAAGRQF
jgi:chromosome partitioning protein